MIGLPLGFHDKYRDVNTVEQKPLSLNCPKCSASRLEDALFCPKCGWDLSKVPLHGRTPRIMLTALLVGSALFGTGWGLSSHLAGVRPKTTWEESRRNELNSVINDPNILALRKATETNPTDIKTWRSLAKGLGEKIISMPDAPAELAVEMFQVLFKIVELDPNDAQALVTLGNMHYNHQEFEKAQDLLSRYLAVVPEDNDSRATLGSVLTFLGKYEDAERELNKVLIVDPKHFVAKANLAINYSEKGDLVVAKRVGNEALALAPDDDSREKLAMFLGHMKSASTVSDSAATDTHGVGTPKPLHPVAEQVKKNPIAGPKFVDSTFENKELTLRFRDFPMAQMPPFAKEKFLAGILKEAKLQSDDLVPTAIIFVDADSAAELERVKVP